jgi:hypothetical protein
MSATVGRRALDKGRGRRKGRGLRAEGKGEVRGKRLKAG